MRSSGKSKMIQDRRSQGKHNVFSKTIKASDGDNRLYHKIDHIHSFLSHSAAFDDHRHDPVIHIALLSTSVHPIAS